MVNDTGLEQMIDKPTRKENILDLFLTTHSPHPGGEDYRNTGYEWPWRDTGSDSDYETKESETAAKKNLHV